MFFCDSKAIILIDSQCTRPEAAEAACDPLLLLCRYHQTLGETVQTAQVS